MSPSAKPHSDSLDWLAFCYAAGELDAAESEQFEARLADDQSAREALARAVELTQTVAAAESQPYLVTPAAKTSTHWQSRISWMAIGGVASLLLGLLWSSVVGPTWQSARQTAAARSRQQLAYAWTETRQQMTRASEPEVWSAYEAALLDADVPLELFTDESEFDEAPSWMMAAVYARSTSSAPTDLESNERLEN